MTLIDYQRIACEALGLKHSADIEPGEVYHNIGTFRMDEAPESALKVIDAHRDFIIGAVHAHADKVGKNFHPDDRKKVLGRFWSENGFLTYEEYGRTVKSLTQIIRDWERNIEPNPIIKQLVWGRNSISLAQSLAGYLEYLALPGVSPSTVELVRKEAPALIPDAARKRSTYVLGRNGYGKTTLLKTLIHSSLKDPTSGMVIIEPHGDFSKEIAQWKELQNNNRLVYIEPGLSQLKTPRLNPLDLPPETDADQYSQELSNVFEDMLTGQNQGFTTNMRSIIQFTLRILVEHEGTTLLDFLDFLTDGPNAKWVEKGRKSSNMLVRRFFETEFLDPRYHATKGAISSKVSAILSQDAAGDLFVGPSTFDIETLLNQNKIIIFNLSKGAIGENASEALGRFVLGRLHGIALRRARQERVKRIPVHVFVDECQNFIGSRIEDILTEDRKYGIYLTLAHQFRNQIPIPNVKEAVIKCTDMKLIGYSSEDNTIAKEMALPSAMFRGLAQGEFIYKSGNKPPITIKVRSDFADEANNMHPEAWNELVRNQLKLYYTPKIRADHPSADNPRPDLI